MTNDEDPLLEYFSFRENTDVSKRFFVIFVALVTVIPRMPLDEPFTIGGNLSHSFRKLLLVIVAGYLFRHAARDIIPHSVGLLMTAIDGVCLSFLSLLTPYLLRKWMADKVNIPGGRRNPGRALMPWVKLFIGLSSVGFLVRIVTGDRRYWIIKKIADVLSFIPVMNTLRMYNSITTSQTRYPGRGSVISQCIAVCEWNALVSYSAEISIRVFSLMGVLPEGFTKTPLAKGLYANILFAGYLRVLSHGILLNLLDEAYTIGTTSWNEDSSAGSYTRSSTPRRAGPTVETVDDDETAMVMVP